MGSGYIQPPGQTNSVLRGILVNTYDLTPTRIIITTNGCPSGHGQSNGDSPPILYRMHERSLHSHFAQRSSYGQYYQYNLQWRSGPLQIRWINLRIDNSHWSSAIFIITLHHSLAWSEHRIAWTHHRVTHHPWVRYLCDRAIPSASFQDSKAPYISIILIVLIIALITI